MTVCTIMVRFELEGFHRWPGATPNRVYLASRHRHKFHWRVELTVGHLDRETEFHDLLEWCRENAAQGELGGMSCEQMARELLNDLTEKYPGRRAAVEVWEDDEVGARVSR
jgi:hypothetical protein